MKKKQSKFKCDVNGGIMVVAALRYALGRHTYVPGAVQDWISQHWDNLDSKTRIVVVIDTFKHIYDEKTSPPLPGLLILNDQYDLSTWEKFGIDKYWKLDYNERKSVDLNLTSDKDRARWFAERLYGTQPV
jgi:hypothetical protein